MEFIIIFIPLLIFLIAFIPRFLAASKVDMTWDEGLYIVCGAMAVKNVAKRNFSSDAWSFEFHPPIIMYLYGMAYALYAFLTTAKSSRSIPSLGSLYREGVKLFTGRKALLATRFPSVILGSLSCTLVYIICLDVLKNQSIGIVAALILALTPSFIAWSSLAMLESGVTFFYLLTIWTFMMAVELNSIGYLIVSGISLGLALGSKETGFAIPLVVIPPLASLALEAHSLDASVNMAQTLLLWLIMGFLTLYVMWPWLWRNPIRQFMKTLRATSKMASRKGAGWSFYLVNMFTSTPIALLFLYAVGLTEALYLSISQPHLLLLLAWVALPLILMSSPLAPKRGGAYEMLFILPPLSILSGLAIYDLPRVIVENATGFLTLNFDSGLAFWLLASIFLGLLVLSCVKIYPYYIDYCNPIAKYVSKIPCLVGWWGEGMAEAIAYVDKHAPHGSTVWIYGPRTTSFYHSSRVDLKKSIGDEPLFYERTKAGFNVQVENIFYEWRKGDLKFYFPYYYPETHSDLDIVHLRAENLSYIIVYRWATYEPTITAIDPGNNKLISAIRSIFKPVFTVKIKDIEVCWIYKVEGINR